MERRFEEITGQSFKTFYNNNYKKIYWYVIKSIRNLSEDVYNEIINDAFLKVLSSIETFDPKKSKIETWLHNTTKLMILTWISTNRNKKAPLEINEDIIAIYEIDESNGLELKRDKLYKTIKIWNKIEHKIENKEEFLLRVVEGLSYEEIASRLNLNINTVKSRIRFVRQQLLKHISKE